MDRISRQWVYLGIISILISGCDGSNVIKQFSPVEYSSDKHPYILLFDLQNDNKPNAKLFINNDLITPPQNALLLLPFSTTQEKQNERLLSSSESYNGFTLVNLIHRPKVKGIEFIGFTPTFYSNFKEGDLAHSNKPIIFSKDGLQRRFIYSYSNRATKMFDTLTKEGHKYLHDYGLILVALPEGSVGREIRDAKTSIPSHITTINSVRAYPSRTPKKEITYLEVRYEIPQTKAQEQLVEALIKIFMVITTPLLILIFLSKSNIKSPMVRTVAISIALVAQTGIVGVFIYVLWSGSLSSALSSWLDIVILVVSTAFSIAVFLAKKDE